MTRGGLRLGQLTTVGGLAHNNKTGELIRSAGAYGSSMASNYNTRNRAAEVLVDGSGYKLIRQRETVEQQMANELACL